MCDECSGVWRTPSAAAGIASEFAPHHDPLDIPVTIVEADLPVGKFGLIKRCLEKEAVSTSEPVLVAALKTVRPEARSTLLEL